jgi:pimeloyl-ACP methyl ester carboxylesterase
VAGAATLNEKTIGSLESVLRAYANGTIFGETSGEGKIRVIWLHGWGRTGADFAESAELLAQRGVASLALDLPGFGASPPPATAGGARTYATLLVSALKEVGSTPVVLVGHSFGGRIASVLASTYPELVSGVLFTGAPLVKRSSGGRSPLAYRIIRKARRLGLVSESRLEKARQRYGSVDYRAAQGVMREVLVASVNESYEVELKNIHQKVIALWGSEDHDVPFDVAYRALGLIPGENELELLMDIGHLVPFAAPADLARVTEKLLS